MSMQPMAGRSRWPLLLALLPLLLGLAVYGQLWRGWAAQFETTLAGWFPGQNAQVSGFPYRLETELRGVMLARDGTVMLRARLAQLRLNRGPWRPELTVAQVQGAVLAADLPGLSPRVTAAAGTASLKLAAGRLERLSIVLPAASGSFGLAGAAPGFRADSLELHARERAAAAPPASDPRLPQRGQLVIGAQGLRIGLGAPISLAGDAALRGMPLRGAGRLIDWQRWAAGGGSADLVLSGRDATGELFAVEASLVPDGTGLRLAGSIRTVCPLAVQAALAGMVPPAEQRLRAPIRLTIETQLPATGAAALRGLPANLAARPRRAQLPACPRLA